MNRYLSDVLKWNDVEHKYFPRFNYQKSPVLSALIVTVFSVAHTF